MIFHPRLSISIRKISKVQITISNKYFYKYFLEFVISKEFYWYGNITQTLRDMNRAADVTGLLWFTANTLWHSVQTNGVKLKLFFNYLYAPFWDTYSNICLCHFPSLILTWPEVDNYYQVSSLKCHYVYKLTVCSPPTQLH